MNTKELIALAEKELGTQLSDKMQAILAFIFTIKLGQKCVKDDQFRYLQFNSTIESKFHDHLIKENSLTVRDFTYDNADLEAFAELLVSLGHLEKVWAYMGDEEGDDGDEGMYIFNTSDPMDSEWVEETKKELKKSEKAFEKYDGFKCYDYHQERGNMVSPWTGRENYDPLHSFFIIFRWTEKLTHNPEYVRVDKDDELKAYQLLASEELKLKVTAKAKEIAAERISQQK